MSTTPVSTTPAANFATISACVVDAGGKFATGVKDTGLNGTMVHSDTLGKLINEKTRSRKSRDTVPLRIIHPNEDGCIPEKASQVVKYHKKLLMSKS